MAWLDDYMSYLQQAAQWQYDGLVEGINANLTYEELNFLSLVTAPLLEANGVLFTIATGLEAGQDYMLDDLYRNYREIQRIMPQVRIEADQMVYEITQVIDSQIAGIDEGLLSLGDSIVAGIQAIISTFSAEFAAIVDSILVGVDGIALALKETMEFMFTLFSMSVTSLIMTVTNTLLELINGVVQGLDDMAWILTDTLDAVFFTLQEALYSLGDVLDYILGDFFDEFFSLFEWDELTVKEWYIKIYEMFTGLGPQLQDYLGDPE